MEKVRYMISDAANIVNVESHVLRYWEDELELDIPRNEMGHRYYTKENIQEFQRIKELKEQGYQLKAIRMIVHNGSMEGQIAELAAGVKAAPDLHQVQTAKVTEANKAGDGRTNNGQMGPQPQNRLKGEQTPPRTQAEAQAVMQPQGGRQPLAAQGQHPGSSPAGAQPQGAYPAAGEPGQTGRQAGLNGQAGQAAVLQSQMERTQGTHPQADQAKGLSSQAGQAAGLKEAQTGRTAGPNPQMQTAALKMQSTEFPGAMDGQLKVRESRQSILNNTDKMAQFTDLMTQIVGKAIAANNHELSRNISDDVGEQVVKELNYLMREREEAEEERFRKLDVAIRGSLKKKEPRRKKWKQKKMTEEPGSV